MAFTKKTKAAPKPASYARKSKKHEEVEVEETEIEEQESDYEDAPEESEGQEAPEVDEPQDTASRRGAGGYQSNNYARPNRQPQPQGRPSYGQRNTQSQGDGKGVRVTGLFAGKREGLWTGRLRREDIENLMGLFDNALNSNQLVTMFLWENQDGPQFSLTANLAQEFKGGGGGRFNRGYRGSIGRR